MPEEALIARAEKHFGEEPCVSGVNGAGTVFFCGCNLRCVFCQNREISRGNFENYESCDTERLCEIFLSLQNNGANNIDLVSPSHYTKIIAEAIDRCGDRLKIPVLYNSGGYDSKEALEIMRGRISVYMPDLKYISPSLSKKYSLRRIISLWRRSPLTKCSVRPENASLTAKEYYRRV